MISRVTIVASLVSSISQEVYCSDRNAGERDRHYLNDTCNDVEHKYALTQFDSLTQFESFEALCMSPCLSFLAGQYGK